MFTVKKEFNDAKSGDQYRIGDQLEDEEVSKFDNFKNLWRYGHVESDDEEANKRMARYANALDRGLSEKEAQKFAESNQAVPGSDPEGDSDADVEEAPTSSDVAKLDEDGRQVAVDDVGKRGARKPAAAKK